MKPKRNLIQIWLLGVGLFAGHASGQNLLDNGSFEFPNTNGTTYG